MSQAFRFVKPAFIVGLVVFAFGACAFLVSADKASSSVARSESLTCLCNLSLCVGILGVAVLIGIAISGLRRELSTYVAGLIAMTTLLPAAAAVFTIIILLAGWANTCAPLLGSVIALGMWLVSPVFARGLADAKHAIPSSYGELRQRLVQLKERLAVVRNYLPGKPSQQTAYQQAHEQMSQINADFSVRGVQWVLATGYIDAWKRLHRAEEALIEVAPSETVLAWAVYDELRLAGSKI